MKGDVSLEGIFGMLWGRLLLSFRALPGRRVIMAVTDGRDTGSKRSWNEVRFFAQTQGIAIFALNYAPVSPMGMGNYRAGRGGYLPSGGGASAVESALVSVCELSGGIVMRMSDPATVSSALEQFVRMLRERYIVEFPRPAKSTGGEHDLEVKIDKGNYIIIRPSGVSVPLPDPAVVTDPTTIQAGPSQAPEEGTRKVINKPK